MYLPIWVRKYGDKKTRIFSIAHSRVICMVIYVRRSYRNFCHQNGITRIIYRIWCLNYLRDAQECMFLPPPISYRPRRSY